LKIRVLINSRRPSLFKDLLAYPDDRFVFLSTPGYPDDIKQHIAIFKPDIFITVFEDYDEEMIQQYYLMKRNESTFDLPFMLIANADICEECKLKNADLFDTMLRRPVTVPAILTNVFEIAGPLCEKRHDDTDNSCSARGKHMRTAQSFSAGSYDRIGDLTSVAEKISKKHILVVDDDKDILRMLKSALEDKYDVTTVSSGKMAEKYLETKISDLILLDYRMPGESGADVLTKIREDGRLANIPVVFLTGVTDSDKVQQVLSMNLQGYLLKPINMDRLFLLIRSLIG